MSELLQVYPNKYKLTPSKIKKLVVLDWDRLRKKTWLNQAMKNGTWYCHLEGSQNPTSKKYEDMDEFWIGFRKEDGKVDYHFTSYEGMCGYTFTKFYDEEQIDNQYDLNVQVNTIKWLNSMIDEGILALG